MRIVAAQINPIVGDLQGNTKKILENIEQAEKKGADVVVFPELALCGYPPEDLLFHPHFLDEVEECLEKIAPSSKNILVIVGTPRRNLRKGEKFFFNSAALIAEGTLLGFYDKCLLPTYDVFDERRYFEPGSSVQIWEYRGKRLGVLICEDIWQHAGCISSTHYGRDPVMEIRALCPDIVFNLSASPYQFQKSDMRAKVCAKSAITLNSPILLCCQVGGNDELVFDGYSMFVDRKGNLQQLAKGFEEDVMMVDLEAPSHTYAFAYDPLKDLYRSLVLGVRDYFYKQGFVKGCLGLSGGIDSALVACIAADALGNNNVLGVSMPSCYTSRASIEDAEKLASHLEIPLLTLPMEKPFSCFLELFSSSSVGSLQGVAKENIQARIRGTLLMAISNQQGYIVLSTGNKSELAVGYCTLYGDMCGGLSVISDVTKSQVYALAKWINRSREIIPCSILEKPPSAELKPNQRDTDSLPDYAIVDAILTAYVEDYLSADQISENYGIPLDMVKDLIQRIDRAEYKRRQAAPTIRVSKKAFRTGRRYPIVERWNH
jgi:NAD+ synthase (glutamine-hydrolysing)